MNQALPAPYVKHVLKYKPTFDFAWGACQYNQTMRSLIHHFKYGHKTILRFELSSYMFKFIDSYQMDIQQFDILVPIPLFSARYRERGFNQAHFLAQQIAHKYNLNISVNNLVRVKNTINQASLSQKDRWTNINSAFRIKPSSHFYGQSVLIIDDLLTTGATVSEVANILKKNGAKTIGVLTLAMTE